MDVVVLGSGPSSGVPTLHCVVQGNCEVCQEAHINLDSKNRRLNPSILVRHTDADTVVLIDCGKTFRETVLRIFPSINARFIDAVLLTHAHADAMNGLDDLREVQRGDGPPMELHCSKATHAAVSQSHGYVLADEAAPTTWVAQLHAHAFAWFQPFQAGGMTFVPLPVWHGVGYQTAAFEFGSDVGKRIVYMPDVSAIPDETRAYLVDPSRPRINVLVIDALRLWMAHPTHLSYQQALAVVLALRPIRTLLTGMGHEFDYAEVTRMLIDWSAQNGVDVRMAYDGLRLTVQNLP